MKSSKNNSLHSGKKAISLFHQAIVLDPDYADALGWLGAVYLLDYQNGWSAAPSESLRKADYFAVQALTKDDSDPGLHSINAAVATPNSHHNGFFWRERISLSDGFSPFPTMIGGSLISRTFQWIARERWIGC